jgi:hypothetical protein
MPADSGVEHLERPDTGAAIWEWAAAWLGTSSLSEDRPVLRKRAQDIIALLEAGQMEQALELLKALVRGVMALGDRSIEAEMLAFSAAFIDRGIADPSQGPKVRDAAIKALRGWLAVP